jgi:hypothetical protein
MSNKNKNKNNQNASVENKNETVENQNEGTSVENKETEGTAEIGADLESAPAEGNLTLHVVDGNTPQYSSLEWLNANNPMDFINETTASSKFDKDREVKISDGLVVIGSITVAGTQINPLLLLLARWWEVKPARTEIKKMIDAEATVKGFAADVYMQIELAKEVNALAEMQSAVDRIRYAKTYYKPRNRELSTAVPTKQLSIDGEVYLVPVAEFEKAKTLYAGLKDANERVAAIRAYIIPLSTKQNIEIEEL